MIITTQDAKAQILHPPPTRPVIVQRMGQTDEPPAYVPRQPSPAQAPLPVSLSQRQHPASSQSPLPRRSASSPALQPPPAPPMHRLSSSKREIIATNFLFFQTRKAAIQDTFHIDSDLPIAELDETGKLTTNRQLYNQEHKQKHRHHSKKNPKYKKQVPNAIFQSKSGDISLNLAIVAPPLAAAMSTTLIQAYSKKGNIDIKIPFINSLRRINLEVSTRHGNILLLIPRSFSGYIQAYSKDDNLTFLPHISATMHIVSRRGRDMQVVVGDAKYHLPKPGTDWTGDTIHVASRDGRIYIGYINEDRKPIEEAGFWRRVFDNALDVLIK